MDTKGQIKQIVGELNKYSSKRRIVLSQDYYKEFKATKTYQNAQNWYNSIKMSNSYAEAKQHNLI